MSNDQNDVLRHFTSLGIQIYYPGIYMPNIANFIRISGIKTIGGIHMEVRFRGKTLDGGKWVQGFYVEQDGIPKIYRDIPGNEWHIWPINRDTVGQYIGLQDNNYIDIYEGDIVRVWGGESYTGIYEYDQNIEVKGFDYYDIIAALANADNIKVIGNTVDNPELIGGACRV